jgi:trimethylamine--corrinoid protein Co-methyltransferase
MIPKFNILTDKEIRLVHENSIRMLEEIGVEFNYEPSCEILRKKGMKVEGHRVFFKRDFIEEMVTLAPKEFALKARNPSHNLVCGGDHIIYMPGYGSPFIIETGREKRASTLADYDTFVKLAGGSKYMHMTGGNVVEPNDIPETTRHLDMTMSHIVNSDKCFMGSALGYEAAMDTIEMTAILHGGKDVIKKEPALSCLIDTRTPLGYDERMLGALHAYAETGQVLVITCAAMSGSTGPAALAGTLSLQNAEILAGIALAESINPGTPVVYGAMSFLADMKSVLVSTGNPEHALFMSASAQLARWYDIPSRGGGATTDAKEIDVQAGYESMMILFATSIAGINFVIHATGILQAFAAMSFEKFIIDDEISGMMLHYLKGFDFSSDEKLAFDVIKEMGPGGNFLTSDHTADNFREEFFIPAFSDRQLFENWNSAYVEPGERAKKMWQKRIDDYTPPALDAGIRSKLDAFVSKRKNEILGK